MAWYMVLKNVYSLWVNCCYGTSFISDLYWCNILFHIEIFIILSNLYTLITIYFYVCRWKVKKKKIINTVNKTFLKITQVMKVAWAMRLVPTKNNDQYVRYQSKALYFLKYLCVKLDILFNVMDIVSQLKDGGLPITIPFCMTKSVLFIYI